MKSANRVPISLARTTALETLRVCPIPGSTGSSSRLTTLAHPGPASWPATGGALVAVAGGSFFLQPIEAAAPAFGLDLTKLPVRTIAEMQEAVAALAREPNTALVVPLYVFVGAHRTTVIELAARHRLPAVYAFRNMAAEGGLMSYGVDVTDLYRRSAAYVDRGLVDSLSRPGGNTRRA